MRLFRRVVGGLHGLVRKTRVERELDAELREYFDAAVEHNVRRGLTREEAIRAARIELGSVESVKDRVRDVGWESKLESVWQDVRYGGRLLRRSPGFTTVVVLLLALGIGANTAVFSLINVLMLRDLPVRDPARLVEFLSHYPGDPRMNGFSQRWYEHYRDHNHVFSDLIGVSPSRFKVSLDALEAETVNGEYVTGNFFPALGLEPAVGRLIGPEDDRSGGADGAVAVLSWSYWDNRFARDPAVVGKRLVVNGVPATIVGVTPRGFFGLRVGLRDAVWVPVAMAQAAHEPVRRISGQVGLMLMGRLKTGVSIETARAEMSVLDRPRVEELAVTSRDPLWRQTRMEVESARAGFSPLREQLARPLLALMAIVTLLLLIACTNVAGMLLARGAARRREMAMRIALGAGRLRLARQVLTESVLLSVAASAIALGLAYFAADALARSWPFDVRVWPQPPEIPVTPDLHVLLFTGGVALLTGLLFGMAPAWTAITSAPASSLRDTVAFGETKARRLFGQSLIVAQVALSVVLLSAAALLVRHLSNLRNVDLGFRRESVLLVSLDPARSGYQRGDLAPLYQELLGRLQAIPGVRTVTLSAVTPIEGPAASRFIDVEGFQENSEDRRRVMLNWVAPKYFETLGTTLVAGRDFQFEDEGRPRVAIVNLATARHYFGDRSPIGMHFTFEQQTMPYEIVGVVGDAKYSDLHEAAPRTVYLNAFQDARGLAQQLALRTNVAPATVAGDVRRTVGDVLKTVPVAKMRTLSDQVDASIVPERLMAMLSGLFGALGATLAAVGLYGLLAYTVTRRTNEIGIRMALGASRRDVTRMVLRGALGLVCTGLVVGAPFALWSRRVAASLIPNLPADAAFPIAVAAIVMIAVALLAAYLPARRAARVNPMEALRHS